MNSNKIMEEYNMKFVNGKWKCCDCGKEMEEYEYVSLDCCGDCYHIRICGE